LNDEHNEPQNFELFKMSVIKILNGNLIKAKELAEQSREKNSFHMSHETVPNERYWFKNSEEQFR
jgi:hypothetical protein